MKKRYFILIILLLISLIPLIGCNSSKKETLNIYNWGDYIDPEVLKDFEKEFDAKIIYNTFATNEDMYIAIKKGGTSYDVVFPSDYMIERMRKEGLLEKLDKDIIENFKYVDENLLDYDFDPNNEYSMPYYWGTVGIAYNKKYIDEKDVTSWSILWDEKYKDEIFMLDSQRDSFAVALKKLGYSMNSIDINELNEAKDELIKQKEILYAYVGDEVKDLMIAEEGILALAWSGDAIAMVNENENIGYAIPEEGTNLWFDSICIPKNSKNKKLANQFINFLNRPTVAARNTNYVEYVTGNLEAKNYLDEDIINSKIAYPDEEVILEAEVFKDPKDMLRIYNDLWIEVKATRHKKKNK